MGPGPAERRGVEQLGLCVEVWCCQDVEGTGGPRGCLGESDRVQMGVPEAGGVRGALRHTHRRLAKEPCYSKLHRGESWAWRHKCGLCDIIKGSLLAAEIPNIPVPLGPTRLKPMWPGWCLF